MGGVVAAVVALCSAALWNQFFASVRRDVEVEERQCDRWIHRHPRRAHSPPIENILDFGFVPPKEVLIYNL
jgi:hypothetical protein